MARFQRPAREHSVIIARWREKVLSKVWGPELVELPTWQAFGIYQLRALYLAVTGFQRHRGNRQAAALTYATLLSLVPALALAFSLFKVWGLKEVLDEHFKPYLMHNLLAVVEAREQSGALPYLVSGELAAGFGEDAPGADSREARGLERAFRASEPRISQLIDDWVDNIQTGRLALPNLIVLIFTVLFLLGAMEKALNEIWEAQRHRTFIQRIPVYWSVITLGSVLIGFSLYYTTVIQNRLLGQFLPSGSGFDELFALSSVFLTWMAFFIFYTFLPNTRVRLIPALVGSMVAGFCWELFKRGFSWFAASSSSYISIYGVFWSVPVFIVWIYLSWIIVLFGAEIVLAYQNIHQIRPRSLELDPRARERVGIELAIEIARAFIEGTQAPSIEQLVRKCGAPLELVAAHVEALLESGLIAAAGDGEQQSYVPARPPDKIGLADIFDVLRDGERSAEGREKALSRIYEAIEEKERSIISRVRLSDLVAGSSEVVEKLSFQPLKVRLRLKDSGKEEVS